MTKTLKDMTVGDRVKVVGFRGGPTDYRKTLLDMGLTKGTEFILKRKAPLGDPIEIFVRGYALTLRGEEAEILEVEKIT